MADADFQRLPGFRDFPPDDLEARRRIFEAWRRVSRRYGFVEYDGPPLEPLELYVEKSGEEIVDQLYAFTDKGDREVALRPEMTPSLARILGERSRAMPKPIRWFSIPQLFRYERQQRGRLREHFQWNVDVVGEDGVGADAEVLAVALDGLRELGLEEEHIRARVSDRRLLTAILEALGVGEERRGAAFAVVDKIEREPRERTLERLEGEAGMSAGNAETLLEVLGGPGLESVRERLGDRDGVAAALEPLAEYVGLLDDLGLVGFVEVDLRIVRGLAYYTGIVFEIFDRRGELRAVCGGGRYDRLLERVGGEPLGAVGFGMGDVVLRELLDEYDLLDARAPGVDYFLVSITPAQRSLALELAGALRQRGRSVTYPLRELSVRKQFSAASSADAREVVVLGPDEVDRGVAQVRLMASGEEREVPLDALRRGESGGEEE